MNFRVDVLLFLAFITNVRCELEVVRDDELVNLIRSEKYVVALFSKKYCEECVNFENELTGLREDLVESLNAWVVKLVDSTMTRLYSPTKEPAIVFFRHGVPLLYDGPLTDEAILHIFTNNKEPAVKELNDDNFEHLTQSSTGATTGDWFVQFYTTDCIECQRLQARWEAVGAHLKSRINVARVNRVTAGAKTARRFNVFDVPVFILFRKGKMYRYHEQDYQIKSLVVFAQDWYKNAKPEPIPVPKSPFDDLIALTVTIMKENPYLRQIGFATFILGLVAYILMIFLKKIPTVPKSKSAQKKSSTKKSSKRE